MHCMTAVLVPLNPLMNGAIPSRPTSNTHIHVGDLGNVGTGHIGKTSRLLGCDSVNGDSDVILILR